MEEEISRLEILRRIGELEKRREDYRGMAEFHFFEFPKAQMIERVDAEIMELRAKLPTLPPAGLTKRWIPDEATFEAMGLNKKDIIDVTLEEINRYPTGPTITSIETDRAPTPRAMYRPGLTVAGLPIDAKILLPALLVGGWLMAKEKK